MDGWMDEERVRLIDNSERVREDLTVVSAEQGFDIAAFP